MADHYATLGVPRTSTAQEVRAAYLALARDRHPDRIRDANARRQAVEFFKDLTAAYDVLSRERSRRDYDARNPQAGGSVRAAAPSVRPGPSSPGRTPAATTASGPSAPRPAAEGAAVGAGATPRPIESGRVNLDALAQGIEAFRANDFHTAVQLLRIAVTRDEADHRAHGFLGLALAKNPNWVRDGVQHLETAARLAPKNPSYPAELALLFHSQGLKLRARRALDAALAIQPGHPDTQRAFREIGGESTPDPETAGPAAGGGTGAGTGGGTGTTGEVGRGLLSKLRRKS
jgi:hypothetical protein